MKSLKLIILYIIFFVVKRWNYNFYVKIEAPEQIINFLYDSFYQIKQ